MNKKFLLYAFLVSLLATSAVSCDKDNDDNKTIIYSTSNSSALLKRFSLRADEKRIKYADSVKFSIDQDKKIIYNADSLPKGTDVSKMLVKLEFGSTVATAKFVVGGGKVIKNDTTIEYSETMKDSIDFTGKVKLNVTSQDGSVTMSYDVKVNVHQVAPDSIVFPMSSRRNLPAAGDDNYALGMTRFNGEFYSMVYNSNGRYMCTAMTPDGKWDTEAQSPPFTPVEGSLSATDDALYVLDNTGNLYTSTDGQTWAGTGYVWKRIIGTFNNQVLGISEVDGQLYSDAYPAAAGQQIKALPKGFPVTGSSQLIVEQSDWAINKVALMVGGRDIDGNLVKGTWGYDGNTWAEMSRVESAMPALDAPTLFSYYTCELNNKTQHATTKLTWIVMGGKLADGSFNRTTYMSRDMGITWTKASTSMQIPAHMPSFSGALAFVCTETAVASKVQSRIAKPITEWEVPYVYIVGGNDSMNHMLNNVWKGTILQLTFKPVY